jgi:hypothetical protein
VGLVWLILLHTMKRCCFSFCINSTPRPTFLG